MAEEIITSTNAETIQRRKISPCFLNICIAEVCDALFCEVNPIPVKAAMNMMGMEVGSLRAPLTEMEDANKERLRKAMVEYGLIK